MSAKLITLTTDFGLGSPYVAAMKGAILAVNPTVQLIDLSHRIPPQDLRACSWFLRSVLPYFPNATIHVIVVDPGVGSDRALLYVEAGGQRLLVPDNGCWTEFARQFPDAPSVLKLTERRFWREQVSATFHGRDILGPVAGHLSKGVRPEDIGTPVNSWVELALPAPRVTADRVDGEVLFVDDFGNLITNVNVENFQRIQARIHSVSVAGSKVDARPVQTYADGKAGELVILASSGGTIEIAEVGGNAARRMGVKTGVAMSLLLRPEM